MYLSASVVQRMQIGSGLKNEQQYRLWKLSRAQASTGSWIYVRRAGLQFSTSGMGGTTSTPFSIGNRPFRRPALEINANAAQNSLLD